MPPATPPDYEHRLVASGELARAIHYTCAGYPPRVGVFGQLSGAFENLSGVVWWTAQAACFRKGLAFVQEAAGGDPNNFAANAEFLREVVGNPFRPVAFDLAWRTADAVALARRVYESGEVAALPVLADALDDAGCDAPDVLNHCRTPGPHVRGCWVVDGVLETHRGIGT